MGGKLYVVGTPIGNLGDMSPRAIQILESVDLIAAEDTRVSLKLLNHFNIKKPMISYYEHNIREKGEIILNKIINGTNVAIITDAGMPCISDPGEDLVKICGENNVEVIVVPGPTAAMSVLAISGLNTKRFSFEGFLTVKKTGRYALLEKIKNDDRTLIFYEAPHKLTTTLDDMYKVFGDRKIVLGREITKLYEEVIRTTLEKAIEYYKDIKPRGEYVIIVDGKEQENEVQVSFENALEMVYKQYKSGVPLSQASKDVAKETGYKKGDLYKHVLDM